MSPSLLIVSAPCLPNNSFALPFLEFSLLHPHLLQNCPEDSPLTLRPSTLAFEPGTYVFTLSLHFCDTVATLLLHCCCTNRPLPHCPGLFLSLCYGYPRLSAGAAPATRARGTHTHTHTHTLTHTHTHTHTHTNTQTHTHTHTGTGGGRG
jgi:hypothetical protein